MLEKWCNHHVLPLLAALTAVSSTGFSQAQVELGKQTISFPSKLLELFKSSGVATLSIGPVWESTGNMQTFYLAPSIEKTYSANHGSHALVDGEIFLGIQKSIREKLDGAIRPIPVLILLP
jgi:hypothetical protein